MHWRVLLLPPFPWLRGAPMSRAHHRCCFRSFLQASHTFTLYTYPSATTIPITSEILSIVTSECRFSVRSPIEDNWQFIWWAITVKVPGSLSELLDLSILVTLSINHSPIDLLPLQNLAKLSKKLSPVGILLMSMEISLLQCLSLRFWLIKFPLSSWEKIMWH